MAPWSNTSQLILVYQSEQFASMKNTTKLSVLQYEAAIHTVKIAYEWNK